MASGSSKDTRSSIGIAAVWLNSAAWFTVVNCQFYTLRTFGRSACDQSFS